MKRKHTPFQPYEQEEIRPSRKRFARAPEAREPLPCKFKLLRPWELTQEVSRYLEVCNQIEECCMDDRTNPQWAVVPYSPNRYQNIIDEIGAHLMLVSSGEPMDIEEVEVYSS